MNILFLRNSSEKLYRAYGGKQFIQRLVLMAGFGVGAQESQT